MIKSIWPLAEEIARHLGFTAHHPATDYDQNSRAFLRHDDGREICLVLGISRYGYAPEGKILVYGLYGMDENRWMSPRECGVIRYDEKEPQVNISALKTAERIASEIERRFLPQYTKLFHECQKVIAKRQAQRAAIREYARKIAERAGVDPETSIRHDSAGYRAYVYIPGMRQIDVSLSGVKFSGEFPLDMALEVVDTITRVHAMKEAK